MAFIGCGIGGTAGSDHRNLADMVAHLRDALTREKGGYVDLTGDDVRTLLETLPRWRPMEEALPLIPAYKPDGYNAHWRCLLRLPQGQATEDYVTLGRAYWVPPTRKSPDKPPLLRWGCPTGQCWPKFWMPLPDVSDG